MEKLILISCILILVPLSLRYAGDPDPRRGLKRAVVTLAIFNFLYMIGLFYVLPRL